MSYRVVPARFPIQSRTMPSLAPQQIAEVRKIFSDYLKGQNLRQTRERVMIFEEVYASDDHFDADELYLRLKQAGIAVSRATVYNTLDLLIECEAQLHD